MRSQSDSAKTIQTSLTKSVVAPLPAINRPITKDISASPSRKHKTTDQLAALSKFSSRISKIDQPYDLGVSVNRKGPSQYANLKDKSDRATNEQVLDPRTRIILCKMIGRELIYEVNGCVSTGKEVSIFIASPSFSNNAQCRCYHPRLPPVEHLGQRLPCTNSLQVPPRPQDLQNFYSCL